MKEIISHDSFRGRDARRRNRREASNYLADVSAKCVVAADEKNDSSNGTQGDHQSLGGSQDYGSEARSQYRSTSLVGTDSQNGFEYRFNGVSYSSCFQASLQVGWGSWSGSGCRRTGNKLLNSTRTGGASRVWSDPYLRSILR
jgi:hypothetical protein